MSGRTITCVCGASVPAPEPHQNLGEDAKATGYSPYMNVRRGLETTWICPACETIVKAALDRIEGVFGELVSYIHFGSKFAARRRAKEGKPAL